MRLDLEDNQTAQAKKAWNGIRDQPPQAAAAV
jgi:hypothetical protein